MSVTSTWVAFRRSVSADFRDSSVIDVCAMVVVVVANRLSKMEGTQWGVILELQLPIIGGVL